MSLLPWWGAGRGEIQTQGWPSHVLDDTLGKKDVSRVHKGSISSITFIFTLETGLGDSDLWLYPGGQREIGSFIRTGPPSFVPGGWETGVLLSETSFRKPFP